MLHECQTWSEKARMQINDQKSKVMAFHETPAQKRKRKEQKKKTGAIPQSTFPLPAI
jgi:ribosome assembly protein YihI (activator of Der GTPase)